MDETAALWPFSLRAYAARGVAEACLALQARRAADVNLLLWCGWRAAMGGGACDASDLRRAIALAAPWQIEVVLPLRMVRQALKRRATSDGDVAAFRDEVKRQELEAERLEQLALARLGDWPCDDRRSVEDRCHDAVLSFTAYLAMLGAEPDDSDRRDMAVVAAACVSALTPPAGASDRA